MDLYVWLTFVVASTVLLTIPGPTILLVISYGLSQGRRVAVASATGVALGDFVAMTASLAGLGALVLASAELFVVLKWVGAAYLIYLGISLFRSAPSARLGEAMDAATLPARGIFWHAAAVTALNPKSIVFFVAFVPQFIDTGAALMPQFLVLVSTFVGLAVLNALAYALLADILRDKLIRPSVMPWMTRAGGGVLAAMGVAVASTGKATA